MENIAELKEIMATLNLESETTLEIINEIMPLIWWTFVWSDILRMFVLLVLLLPMLFIVYKMITQ